MREVIFQDEDLKKLIEDRDAITQRVDGKDGINIKIIALDKERTKEAYKMAKLKTKITDILNAKNIEKGEFEEWGIIVNTDKGTSLQIYDKVEEYKEMLKEEKNKREEK